MFGGEVGVFGGEASPLPPHWIEPWKWFALFGIGSERQDLLQNNCMLLVQEQRNKK